MSEYLYASSNVQNFEMENISIISSSYLKYACDRDTVSPLCVPMISLSRLKPE
jgi:hypothetical protein